MTIDELTSEDPDAEESPSKLRKLLQEELQKRQLAEARLTAIERREAFTQAGLDPKDKLHQVVMANYEGPLDQDEIDAYVQDLGLPARSAPAVPPGQPETGQPDERAPVPDVAAMQRIAEATGGITGRPLDRDRREELRKQMEQASRRGNIAEMDRIATEFARAGEYPVLADQQNQ